MSFAQQLPWYGYIPDILSLGATVFFSSRDISMARIMRRGRVVLSMSRRFYHRKGELVLCNSQGTQVVFEEFETLQDLEHIKIRAKIMNLDVHLDIEPGERIQLEVMCMWERAEATRNGVHAQPCAYDIPWIKYLLPWFVIDIVEDYFAGTVLHLRRQKSGIPGIINRRKDSPSLRLLPEVVWQSVVDFTGVPRISDFAWQMTPAVRILGKRTRDEGASEQAVSSPPE